ncbi:MAG: DUF167 domain-containing protein [Proteobacteria bacterium]|nr:DUF167 domain-containing protein [Pseudomonadota bacterium]HQR03810.1 DUF167 domain-containing protein [Rhodocyclaceae bacterium]
MNGWARGTGNDTLLILHIQPGARQSEVAGLQGDALKIRLQAPPVDGKANAALIRFLAAQLHLPQSCIMLKSGHSGRRKQVTVSGLCATEVRQRLLPVPC